MLAFRYKPSESGSCAAAENSKEHGAMVFGYTPLDPLVVICGTLLTIWYLNRNAVKLIGFMPTALSLWFFVPFVTSLTLWQTVPLLLTGRILLRRGFCLPRFAQPVTIAVALSFVLSAGYALVAGADETRALIRILYYLGLFAIFSFSYEMGRKPEAYEILLKGLVVMGVVYATYGAYQLVALYTGLPMRGIVYSASSGGSIAFENGLLRINSLANEPKRLGYVLFLAALACIFLARMRVARRARQLKLAAGGIFMISILTFAGSYFSAIALFTLSAFLLYPSRAILYLFGFLIIAIGVPVVFTTDFAILDALQYAYERRMSEIELGLDGEVVYRQEFFAWDYLTNNPFSYLTGVGVGQYYSEFNKAYGVGAGYNQLGDLMPLNSNFLEMIFDLGVIAAGLIYIGLTFLIFKLRGTGETFFCLSLLFLMMQSLTILNFLQVALVAGVAMGRLTLHQKGTFQK